MRAQVLWVALALAGCAGGNPGNTALWRDVSGQHRQDQALHADEAACDYEVSMAMANAPDRRGGRFAAGEFTAAANNLSYIAANSVDRRPLERKCMAARGWSLAGWE